MEGLRKLLLVFSLIIVTLRFAESLGSIKPNESLRDGETLVSPGGMFELGFFSTGNSGNRFLGIWFKKDSTTVVWVANRENPLIDKGVLNFTDKGMLVLADATDKIIWSSNISAKNPNSNPVATLLDSGNFVVKGENNDNDPEKFLWQSFDHPCDTLLPGMKIGRDYIKGVDKFLSSWKSAQNPSPGQFSLAIDLRGVPQLVIKKGKNTIIFRAGSWNGVRFTGAPGLRSDVEKYYFVASNREIYHSFELRNKSSISRYYLNPIGVLQRFTWNDMTNDWSISASTQADQCENYALCGAYGSCNLNKNPICQCLEGFVSKSLENPSSSVDRPDGRVRKTALACDDRDGFFNHAGIKLPDTARSSVYPSMNINECRQMCLRNCSCSAFANSDIRGGGSGCLLWFGNLMDMKDFNWGGQDLYIRLAATELARIYHENRISDKQKAGVIAGTTVLAMGMLILGLALCIWKRRLRKKEKIDYLDGENEEMELPLFDLKVIVTATNNFSDDNKLGRGGFGPVYKGTLPEGKDIAVKRLSKNSGQGLKEFKNEVVLIAKLQHRNLVKLLGCCIEGDEKMLIYEYMPNKSLDSFIFDQNLSKLLNWHMRMRIIGGIARGMLYLHQDSRHRIIHRDLKASNVLLDKDMNPKISDFGMARMFRGDETGDRTRKVVRTYGYMSPEYAVDGHFSIKSDVYSFGVLVLEIVNGRKNRGFSHLGHDHNLLGHAWILWMESRPLDLMDDVLADSCVYSEVLRCIHVGLLCVQKRVEDRPNMSSVVLMLNGESSLPQPKQPGFFTERSMPDSDTSSSKHGSTNDVSITSLEPR